MSAPPSGTASPHPATAPLLLARKKPSPVGDEASPAQSPFAPFKPVQPDWSGEAAVPNALGNRNTLRSQ